MTQHVETADTPATLRKSLDSHQPAPSKAAIKQHPIHPMLIPFPIALLFLVPVTDIVFAVTANPFWAEVSYYLLWAGIISGAIAAIFGLVDFLAIKRVRAHRAGWFHLGANAFVIALAVVNLILRIEGAAAIVPGGVILSLVTAGLLIVGGWYGGELSYRYRVGVTEHA